MTNESDFLDTWLYIVSQNASGLYIWKVRIILP